MDYALIDDTGLVVNVVIWDGESTWQPPEDQQLVELPAGVGIGWTYVDGNFVAPEMPEAVE